MVDNRRNLLKANTHKSCQISWLFKLSPKKDKHGIEYTFNGWTVNRKDRRNKWKQRNKYGKNNHFQFTYL